MKGTHMKRLDAVLCCSLIVSFSTFAGTSSGGGGVGVRCQLPNGETTLETLDLHEAKLQGLEIEDSSSAQEAIELSSTLMARHYYSGDARYVDRYKEYLKVNYYERLFAGQPVQDQGGKWITSTSVTELPLSNDYGTYEIASKCHLEQIAYFDDEESVLKVNRTLFNEMNYVNQMALLSHEIIYFLDRNDPSLHEDSSSSRTSKVSRFFVGKLFSNHPPKSKYRVSEESEFFSCESSNKKTELRIYSNADGTHSLHAGLLSGHKSPFRVSTKLSFDPKKLTDMLGEINHEGSLEVSDLKTNDVFTFKLTKSVYGHPNIQIFKNSVTLGQIGDLVCWIND